MVNSIHNLLIPGKVLTGNDVEGVLAARKPWPSIARTIYKDHQRYLDTYMKPYPGYFFFGDGAARDEDGYIWIKGRVDDVIKLLTLAKVIAVCPAIVYRLPRLNRPS
jgi:non-ribosomal peptide synthetase component E (peptide arylation enzyme)